MQKVYRAGDIALIYDLDEMPTWTILPLDMIESVAKKDCAPEPLVDYKILGEDYPEHFLHGHSMRYSPSSRGLSFAGQESKKEKDTLTVETTLSDRRGHVLRHIAMTDGMTVRVHTVFENNSEREVSLEMITSFTLGGLTPFDAGDASGTMLLHRLQSFWSAEGRLESRRIEEYQLEPSWSNYGGRVMRFGQVGSMPVREYFPFVAIEDQKSKVLWGAQLAIASSWQMEVSRLDNGLSVSGGIADREFGHWMKAVRPGECFETPEAILSVCHGSLDNLCARLVTAQENTATADSEDLPVVFNEFCTTWGDPSVENIKRIAERLDGSGIRYFVIDCGWFKPDEGDWGTAIGDWQYSKFLFPNGIKEAADIIRTHGMMPGIWFEMENVGRSSNAFQLIEHLLKRDGIPITTGNRRFWDMQDPWVHAYLTDRLIGTLRDCGFGYLKVDYNDNIGMGCDGAESQGEALRQKVLASQEFFSDIRRSVPGVVIENCASGGHRLEPSMMRLCDMASFSDAHECIQIPIIAANVQRAIPAWKSQIWAVLRKTDSLQRLYYSLINTFLGRMCLSGDICDLSEKQWQVIREGISFYKNIRKILRYGKSERYGTDIRSYNHPEGWQAVIRSWNDQTLVVFHAFDRPPESIQIPLAGKTIVDFYGENRDGVYVNQSGIEFRNPSAFSAIALLLRSGDELT